MRKTFWLLDVNHEVRGGLPEVWVWAIDNEDRRILIIDRSFQPYFYCIPKRGIDPKEFMEEVKSDENLTKYITRLEYCEKKYFGKKVEAIKITYNDPSMVERCVEGLSATGKVDKILEQDIRFTARYLMDRGLRPCSWYEAEVIESGKEPGVKVDHVYTAGSPFTAVESSDIPKLRILGFSVICYSPMGEPIPQRDPIAIISILTSEGESNQLTLDSLDEESIIKSFIDFINDFDPDIIAGFGTNSRDWNYLLERASKKNLNLDVGRTDAPPHRSVYGHFSITGRINLDLSDYVDDFSEVKLKNLEKFSEFLGVPETSGLEPIDEMDFAEYWEDPEKRPMLLRFSMERANKVIGAVKRILDYSIELSKLVGIPLDYVGSAAVGFKVEWLLMREATRLGELAPERVERPYFPYAGGIVLEPKEGIHENIAVLDFKSLYPNIMVKYNISPDTYVEPDQKTSNDAVYEAPEVKHRFLKEPPGLYKKVLMDLMSARDELRAKLRVLDVESASYRLYDARQKAVKVITNAVYGYAGWLGARWYVKPVAEASSAWGRSIISRTVELSSKIGLKIIYGDTDSIFVEFDEKKIDELSRVVKDEFGLELRPDKVYVRVLFTEAKKRYCGLLKDGRMDFVGFEVVRGDWAEVSKKVQESVLTAILKEKSPNKAREFVIEYISNLKERRVPLKDLVIWKSITKPIEEYKVNAPHIEAAKLLTSKGWAVYPGDKIGYVVTSGSGPIYKRAVPHNLASIDDIDVEYYISNQIVPPVERILKIFGVKI